MMLQNSELKLRILGMIEKQGEEMAEQERQRKLRERLARKERIEEYYRGKRLKIKMEGERDSLSNLNLSNE